MSDTTLTALKTALAPKGGMKRIPFPLESYAHDSPPLSSKKLLNFMAEQAPADARTQAALVPTPGLTLFMEIGAGPIHALNSDLPGRVYVVSGTRFYRLRSELPGWSVDDLGEIGTPATDVIPDYGLFYSIAVGANACVVCVPPNAFTCLHNAADPLNQIGGDFPGATSVAFHDGYHIYTSYEGSARFFITRLLDPNNYDALDFAYADALPNVLHRVIAYNSDLWMMGGGGIEIWYDAGLADFPYRRRSGGILTVPSGGPKVIATADNSVFWVGPDAIVYRSVNYQAQRISTHVVERYIAAKSLYYGAFGFAYSQDGHVFYVLNFPERCLVYDCATKLWHDRESDLPGTGNWRPLCAAQLGNLWGLGDSQSGKIFYSNTTLGTEDGVPITREITFPPLRAEGNARAFCARFEVEMETANDAIVGDTITLTWSDDGGYTFPGGPRVLNAGPGSDIRHRRRVYTTRLGAFRERVFRLTVRGATTIYAADADITAGAS